MSTRFRTPVIFIAIAVTALTVACGGGGDNSPTATNAPPTATTVAPTATTPPAPTAPSGGAGDAARGAQLFVSQTCAACHSTGSNTIVGPGLAGVKERAAAQGGDAYLTQSILDRNAVIVPGFQAVMSDFSGLDAQTVADLVAYLNTLE